MTYDEALSYISQTLRFGSKPGLERISRLLELMGNPQDSLQIIHVAGTNGKGSTSKAIAAALTQSGIKTGLYISPFVTDFRERIQIDGEYITPADLTAGVEHIKPIIEELARSYEQPTEFEIITALALNYYKEKGCDAVVLEVGLGGRFDATNIIKKPLVSVITTISYDHTDILGDTLDKIAFEKSGIIKEGCATVTSPGQAPEALSVIKDICVKRYNKLVIPEIGSVKILNEGIGGTDILYDSQHIHIPLAGRHQICNFITAYETLNLLRSNFDISDENIAQGMAKVKFPARLEVLNKQPLILLDGAHNPSGASALADSIGRYLKEKPVVIMGMLADKDYKTAIEIVAPLAKAFIAVRPDSPRSLDPKATAEVAGNYCGNTTFSEDYKQALHSAVESSQGAPIIICGSLYLAGGMRHIVLQYLKNL